MACNQRTEVYSRIVGYYRPVQQWNKGKQAEFAQRKTFQVQHAVFQKLNATQKKCDQVPCQEAV